MGEFDARLELRLSSELKTAFMKACKDQDRDAAQEIRDCMRDYVETWEIDKEIVKKQNRRRGWMGV